MAKINGVKYPQILLSMVNYDFDYDIITVLTGNQLMNGGLFPKGWWCLWKVLKFKKGEGNLSVEDALTLLFLGATFLLTLLNFIVVLIEKIGQKK